MKKRAMLSLLGLIISSSFVFSQVSKDTLGNNFIYPQFYGYFSAEESWQIHKDAFKRQLESEGLTIKEIEKKLIEYEGKKEELIEKIKQQRKQADIQRRKADEQRKQADIQRQKADEQRKQADILRQKADEQRKLAEIQRQKADEQIKQADILRQKADEQRKRAEEWRNSFEKLFSENYVFSPEKSQTKSVTIKVDKKNTLFFSIRGYVNSGNTLIEILDPDGKKEGELSLEHTNKLDLGKDDKLSNSTSGSLNKTITNPEIGDWSIRISPKDSKGNVNISVAQYIKQTIDE